MIFRDFFLKIYLKIITKMSRGKGYGKKYNVIKSVSNKIETSLITDSAEVWAGKIFLHPNDAFRLSIYGIHSKIDFEIFQKYVKKGDNVLDVGANIGYFTLMLAKLVGPTGKVFAFEPDPRNISLLKKNIETNGYQNVVVVPKAVSNVNEKCTLFTSQSSFGQNRIYEPKKTKNQKYVPIESETILLDDFFKNNKNIEKISFVKIDVEGAEKFVLEGMKKILDLNENIKIFSEIDLDRLDDAGSSYTEMIEFLEKKGFTVFVINDTNNEIMKVDIKSIGKILKENSSSQNILCIREKFNID